MHPIVFRIPLPKAGVPLFWALLAAAGIALAFAGWQYFVKNKQGAMVGAGIGAVAAIAAFTMKGEVWNISPIPIYSYGVMLGLSLVVGWYLTLGLADKEGLPKETMANCYVVTAIAAVIGSRLLYVATNLGEFKGDTGEFDVMAIFAMRRGGLVAYGGFLGGFVGSLLFLRRHKIPLLPWADVAVPSLASGLMITRIGCYLFGCDFGKPLCKVEAGECLPGTTWGPGWLAKLGSFPHWPSGTLDHGDGAPAWMQHIKPPVDGGYLLSRDAATSLPVHPTQIYESLVGVALLVLLLWARKKQKFRGQIFLLFTFAYGVCRFLLEILRDDLERGSMPGSLPEHWMIAICLALFAVGYVIGFSQLVKNVAVQRATQVAAFLPAVVFFFLLKPPMLDFGIPYQLSTSQAVALSTGFLACVGFSVLYKGALAHPEAAMDLGLPPVQLAGGAPGDDDEEEDETRERAARAARRRAKAGDAAAKPSDPTKTTAPAKRKKKKPVEKTADKADDTAKAKDEKEDADAPRASSKDEDAGDKKPDADAETSDTAAEES